MDCLMRANTYQLCGHTRRTFGWPPSGTAASGDDMLTDEILAAGQSVFSANGRFTFVYQGDGNLVLCDDGRALWASGTDGTSVGVCIMQGDGNLVVYDQSGYAVWASGTWHDANSRLVVQDDGNVVIYRLDNTAAWATNTVQP